MLRYLNRRTAGRVLATLLQPYRDAPNAMVLALPRGGVPVGFEIANALHLPLDVFVVRKIGAPGQPELALGAVASGGLRVINEHVAATMGLTEREIEPITRRELTEIARREALYRGGRSPLNVRAKTIIVTDDGLATGATMRAALSALRSAQPAKLIIAVPVTARDTMNRLLPLADEFVCPQTPATFSAVGEWYEDFTQTTDEEVAALLGLRLPPAQV